MKLFHCLLLLLFHVNFVSTLSTAIDNGSETLVSTFLTTLPKIAETKQVNDKLEFLTDGVVSLDVDAVFYLNVYDAKIDNNDDGTAIDNGSDTVISTFLTTLPKIAETKQINDKLEFLTDGVVSLDVDAVFYLDVYDEKIDNNDEGIFFCFKAKRESMSADIKKCPKNYCDVHVRYSKSNEKMSSVFVLMGNVPSAFTTHVKIEIRESLMAVNDGKEVSKDCTCDLDSGYLPVELMNKKHRKVYLTNTKLHGAENATDKPSMDQATLSGIIAGAIIGGVVVIGGIGTALYFCLRKKKEPVKLAKKASNEKTVVLSKEQLAETKEANE
uniref:Uncharacterized protein n=1 Tax=Panagrolaimus sp. JU765 TaxID=591449 RepID=A0AC34Q100_9BILA